MGTITVEKANELFWLGRYAERVYTTLKEFFVGFDHMIDEGEESYENFCKSMDVPNVYESKKDFLEKYPFDTENSDSILSNLYRAYDNALVLRDEIHTATLSYIQLSIYDMKKAKVSIAPLIEMQKVIDNLLAFWGCVDDCVDDVKTRSIIKLGRRVERVDLYLRFKAPCDKLKKEKDKLENRIQKTGLKYDTEKLKKLSDMIETKQIDFFQAIQIVESFVEV